MRTFLLLLLTACTLTAASAQMTKPVSWAFSAEKVADGTFDVTISADIQNGWHVYSQFTPEGGPVPTSVTLDLGEKVHTAKETGARSEHMDELFGVEVIDFSETFTIEQRVKVPAGATVLTGTVEYMTCNGESCLPPTEVPFTISLR